MQAQFPQDVLIYVANFLHSDTTTLQHLALVNQAAASATRSHRWRRVVLRSSPHTPSHQPTACARLYSILVRNDSPAKYIQEFYVDNNVQVDGPATLSTDVYLPLIFDQLAFNPRGLKVFSILKITWPENPFHPLIIAAQNLVRAAPLITTITIDAPDVPTFLIDACGSSLETLNLGGSSLLQGIAEIAQVPTAQPLGLLLQVEPFVEGDIWPRINTSSLRSLHIRIPHFDDNGMLAAFDQYGHDLHKLELDFMEDGDSAYPDFGPLVNLVHFVIAFPTWIAAWPRVLADLIQSISPRMQNVQIVQLYLLVDVDSSDMSVDSEEEEWHQSTHFPALDNALADIHSTSLVNVQISLCPNAGPDANIDNELKSNVWNQLPATQARDVLFVDSVQELPWEGTFRI
ncbi:hypothetical protein H0H87_003693 [Tephrocybe sp. NHM501043]|nr:hypothetical protein H0H87_003693 [Tephrocybe sp. NHM501043]